MPVRDVTGLKQGVIWALITGGICGVIVATLMALTGIVGGHAAEGIVFGLLFLIPAAGIGAMLPGTLAGLIGQRQCTNANANAIAFAHNGVHDVWVDRKVMRQTSPLAH